MEINKEKGGERKSESLIFYRLFPLLSLSLFFLPSSLYFVRFLFLSLFTPKTKFLSLKQNGRFKKIVASGEQLRKGYACLWERERERQTDRQTSKINKHFISKKDEIKPIGRKSQYSHCSQKLALSETCYLFLGSL